MKNKHSVVHLIVIQLINILLWTPTDYQHLHISLPFDILHLGCPTSLFTWALPTKIVYIFLLSATYVTHPTHLIFLSLTSLTTQGYNTNCKASHFCNIYFTFCICLIILVYFCINLLVFLFQKRWFHSLSHISLELNILLALCPLTYLVYILPSSSILVHHSYQWSTQGLISSTPLADVRNMFLQPAGRGCCYHMIQCSIITAIDDNNVTHKGNSCSDHQSCSENIITGSINKASFIFALWHWTDVSFQ